MSKIFIYAHPEAFDRSKISSLKIYAIKRRRRVVSVSHMERCSLFIGSGVTNVITVDNRVDSPPSSSGYATKYNKVFCMSKCCNASTRLRKTVTLVRTFSRELSNSAGEYGRRSSVEVGQEIKKAHAPPARRRGAYLPMSRLVCPQQNANNNEGK
ncbi:4672_t:CDS:2 [Paraglomus brasilianum]|uniref:4672_t:CDS:1 n=1 Tax=Paraglomus brasilianum TaxID=144538 RepID=A0A9N9FYT5_9GLOM|nr:4672_t:CDS:2 [Paraglomus brasilianum]